jgi:hypothetical protein
MVNKVVDKHSSSLKNWSDFSDWYFPNKVWTLALVFGGRDLPLLWICA